MTFRYNPFNKISGNRKSAVSKTSEREFEREIKKADCLQESTAKIQESLRRCIKSQQGQARSESEMVQNVQVLSSFKEDDPLKKIIGEWNRCAKSLELQTEELNSIYANAVIEPMRKFSTIFPSIQQAIKKREQCLQEYTKYQEKVEKYQKRERTGTNAVKLEHSKKMLTSAKTEFEALHFPLLSELPQFYEGCVPYFRPCLLAFIRAQVMYYSKCEDIYADFCTHSKDSSASSIDDVEDLKQSIQQKLSEIRTLSIAADDQIK